MSKPKIMDEKPRLVGFTLVTEDASGEHTYENVAAYTVGENVIGIHYKDDSELFINIPLNGIKFIDVTPILVKGDTDDALRADSQPRIIRPESGE